MPIPGRKTALLKMNSPYETAKGFDLSAYLRQRRKLVNQRLTALLGAPRIDSRLFRAMRHSLMASGKRLRPVLCLAAAEAVGGFSEAVLETACAIEMIHTYSLIHDDLPAMDNDALRRGQPTCHVQFDEATAILAGDALLTLAFETLSRPGEPGREKDGGVTCLQRLRVIGIIARAAGCRGMIEGQMRDMAAEGRHLELSALKGMHALKTGALIRASVISGALLAGAERRQMSALHAYADNIGLAFQVIDDILNVSGDPQRMGKAAGTDRAREKSTYPALMGLDKAGQYAADLVANALQAIEIFGNKAEPLRAVASYIIERDK